MRNCSFYYRLLGKKGTEVFRMVVSFLVLLIALLPSPGEIIPKFLILVYTHRVFSCLRTHLHQSHLLLRGYLQVVVSPCSNVMGPAPFHLLPIFYMSLAVPTRAQCSLLLLGGELPRATVPALFEP